MVIQTELTGHIDCNDNLIQQQVIDECIEHNAILTGESVANINLKQNLCQVLPAVMF